MSETQPLLHHAEELGQGRAYTSEEVKALQRAAVLAGAWGAVTMLLLAVGYWMYAKLGFWGALFTLSPAIGFLVGAGIVLVKGFHEQLDGLRSWREAKTYAPPQSQPQLPAPSDSPFIVHPYKGQPFILQRDGRSVPLLPDGRESKLALNPPTVRAILQEVIKQHGGQWSRDRLMRVQVNGERITRPFYQELTSILARAGFLQPRTQGGYELPPDVQTFEDVVKYIPTLDPDGGNTSRTVGRSDGGPEQGGVEDDPPPGRGVGTLAERHRLARLVELDHSVKLYLERKGDDHG